MRRSGGLSALALTYALALSGAAAFHALGFPAPFLTGPALAVSLAGLAGLRVSIPLPLRSLCFLVIGFGIGTSVTPEVIQTARSWPVSFVILGLALIGGFVTSVAVLRRGFGLDRRTATLSAPPGHLSFVLSLAEDRGGDVPTISLIQSTRVLFLTLALPPLLVPFVPEGGALGPTRLMPLWQIAGLLTLAYGLGRVFRRLSVPAPDLLAAMALSSATHLTELTPGGLPDPMIQAAFLTMGALIGTRFVGVTLAVLRRGVLAGLAVTLVTMTWALAAAWAGSVLLGFPVATLLIAYAPGGLEAMAAMAVILGLEPTFVAAHHVARLILLTVLIPWLGLRSEDGRDARGG